MAEKLLRMFARENFGSGDKHYPVLHRETGTTKPLALLVKRPRPLWKRPFCKMEMIILDGLEKYVESDKVQYYHEVVKTKITKKEVLVKDKFAPASRHQTFHANVAEVGNVTLVLNDDLGELHFGKLRQEYTTDPDLRDILKSAVLDTTKMDLFEEQELLLITSVVYSEKFELRGDMKHQVEMNAEVENPNLTFHYENTFIPPGMATRSEEGPILFKCCRVQYDQTTKQLKIHEEEFVRRHRAAGEDSECYDYEAVMDLKTDETDLPDYFIAADIQKLETIKKQVLMTETTRSQSKARVKKYLGWFEQALVKDKPAEQKLILNKEPLTTKDCKFLRSIFVPAHPNQSVLDLTSLSKDEIQGYGIVFKMLDGVSTGLVYHFAIHQTDLTDDQWTELEKTLDGARN